MTDVSPTGSAVYSRLGVTARLVDGRLVFDLWPRPQTTHHGSIRASVLAYVIDSLAGVTIDGDPQVWTFTTDLSVRMRPVPAPSRITATLDLLRRSSRSASSRLDLVDESGDVIAIGAAGFQHVPRRDSDPPKPRFDPEQAVALFTVDRAVGRPLREEAGVTSLDMANGVAEIAVTPLVVNPAGTLQGAMVALLAEAAVEDLCSTRFGVPALVTDLDIRYLARSGAGPVRTSCVVLGDEPFAPVEVRLTDVSTGTTTTLVHVRAVPVPDAT